ncbi:hypothetical protein LAZ67_4004215 [Cordylochernes scorpioides]|uniref:Uncharacterized protein n=1 Tax=Cordylochernes scorpioides TaxID=51811 RepID=A0ABY6KEA2_9ARAC|nr:hypothetical protein LAZ67_4004215 [Cordylochernes scorpioides]
MNITLIYPTPNFRIQSPRVQDFLRRNSEVVKLLWMKNHVVGDLQQQPTLKTKTRLMTLSLMIEEWLSESYRKFCSKWVPRKLTPDQHDQRVQLCQ